MGRVSLFLDCDAGIFARWLDDYTAGVSLGDFPTGSGYLAVQRARVTQGPSHAPGRLDIEAFHIVTPPNEDEIGQGAYLGSVVSFKVVPLASERIEVTAEYQHPAVQDYFGSLLDEIRKRWPETPASAPTAEVSGDWEAVASKLPPNTVECWLRLGEEQVTITKVENVLNTSFGQLKSETVEFVLNATVGAFVNWLESHASRLQFRPFPTTDNASCMYLQPARVVTLERPSHLAPGLTKLLIWAILPLPQGRAPPDPWPWSWMLTHEEAAVFEALYGTKPLPLPLGIEFAIATLDSERIEVSGRCDFAWLSDAFDELLQHISTRWPEARSVAQSVEREAAPQPTLATTMTVQHAGNGEESLIGQSRDEFEPKDIRERLQEVKRLRKEGLTIHQMSLRLGCSESTVKRDLKKLRERGEL